MTKIIALSDTHLDDVDIKWIDKDKKKYDYAKTLGIDEKFLPFLKNADYLLHAGDIQCQTAYNMLKNLNSKLIAVKGYQNDDDINNPALPPDDLFTTDEGVRVGLVHRAFAETFNEAVKKAKDMDVQVLVFGHIHHPLIAKGERMLICPGYSRTIVSELDSKAINATNSKGTPTYRNSLPSMAQITIESSGFIRAMIIPLKYSPTDYQLIAYKG
ncbi:MAG: metallophosphoesterase family protein [Methanothrix sp.]|nr:metallophosphoesterase family protein [Methanothrix sp.]